MTKEASHPDYPAFLAALKERILHARTFAARAITRELVSFKSIWRQVVAKLDDNSDDIEVEFALKTKTNLIGVAEYQLQARLPAEFKGQLPTAKQLADAVRATLPPRR